MSPTTTSEAGARLAWNRRWWTEVRTSLFWMVFIALALRLGYLVIAHTYRFKTPDDNFSFGYEMGRIGRSLALGQGFGNPFDGVTGRTAWEPPLYPLLIAGVFKVFGIYTHASAFILLGINSVLSALTCIPIFLIAKRSFGETVAMWSAWLWAVLPPVIFWSTRYIWETPLAAWLLAIIFWLTLVLEEKDGLKPWLLFGLLWGVAALTNTSLLSFLPASGLWAWYRRPKVGKRSVSGIILASASFVACLAPWLVRNEEVLGKFIFIRSNFGAELRLGNGPGANGTWMDYLHPTKNAQQLHLYRQLGEIAYVRERKQQALEFIKEDYGRFTILSLKRFVYYWAGLPRPTAKSAFAPFSNSLYVASSVLAIWGLAQALRKRAPGAWLFLWLLILYPLIYYAVFVLARYRHPIEPELLILIVYIISQAEFKRSRTIRVGTA